MATIEQFGGWPAILGALINGDDLTDDQASAAMETILDGDATAAQISAFVVALGAKGETPAELAAMLETSLDHARIVPLTDAQRDSAVDIVGTGGDRSHSINVSTMASIVTAAAGVTVCKHGNRAASSKCGTADVLEELGVEIELSPEGVKQCVDSANIGFCFARSFHPAFRFAGPPRAEIGIPTIFNLLGPMANPGRVRRQLIGVANPDVADRMIATLHAHGTTKAWVVHGNGLDELSTTGTSTVLELDRGETRRFHVDPSDVGLEVVDASALTGGDRAQNAAVVRDVLAGSPGAHRDIVVLNAAAGLVVGDRVQSLAEGIGLAAGAIDSGAAAATLDRFVEASQRAAGIAG